MYEQLESIGLTKTESKLYLALLDLGKSQAGVLSRKTGIHRRSVYDALERLIQKGLVSYIRENEQRYYLASDPSKIQELIENMHSEVQKLLPALKAKYGEVKQKQETSFYRGIEGIKTILEDQIKEGKEVYIIGASKNAKELLKYYLPHYTSKRIKQKVKLYCIYAGEKHKNPIPFAQTKYLPEEFASPVSTNIYGDKIAIILWTFEPVAILIKQKEVAETYKKYFDILWKIAK